MPRADLTTDPRAQGQGALYRIQRVAELTAVPEATLRSWERRYGVPTPARTDSGYRLYGDRDVEQVRTMRRLCDAGLAASEAAKEVRVGTERARAKDSRAAGRPRREPLGSVAGRLVEAVTRFDEDALDRELRRLLLGGAALDDVDESVVPAMRRVGELWHDGELSIAHEHLATNHIGTFLRNVLRLGRRTGTHKALLACFAEEQHEIGLLVVGTWLSAWGVQPVFLGRRVPPSAVADAVRALRPRLVTLSVTISPETSVASALLEEYAEACGDVPWLVGGAGAGPLLKRLPERAGHLAPGVRSEFKAVAARLLETSGGLPREWMSE